MRIIMQLLGVILSVVMLTGCASIMHGPMQNVSITSSPEGANAVFKPRAKNGEIVTVKTPSNVSLHRKYQYEIEIEKAGYESQKRQITKTMDGWVLGNIILGGVIGLVIDLITGSLNKLEPSNIHVDLKKLEAYLLNYARLNKRVA